MKAYKGFNKDMTCRGFQFKEGETYEEDEAVLCESGFHACEAPIDCLSYYAPAGAVYHEVELDDVSDERRNDSKVVGKKITIGAEIGIPGIVKAQIEYVKSRTETEHSAGDYGVSSAGDYGVSSAGDYGVSSAGDSGVSSAGDYGVSSGRGCSSVGKNGIACVRGDNLKVKGGLGSVLVIGIENNNDFFLKEWKAVVVDGEKVKADTWYKLFNGEVVEAEEKS